MNEINSGARRIQVDAFEVQLGAGLLLQFTSREAPVRILADAGVGASYPIEHVHAQLDECFNSFGNDERRIDLIIGTHYDKDHLTGLVPIIKDQTIAIVEAWMPPVADDSQSHGADALPDDHDFLALKFADQGIAALQRYLRVKARICEQVRNLEAQVMREERSYEGENLEMSSPELPENFRASKEEFSVEAAEAYFEEHFRDAAGKTQRSDEHADTQIRHPRSIESIGRRLRSAGFWRDGLPERTDLYYHPVFDGTELRLAHQSNLAEIRKSTAKQAITATWLNRVVIELKNRRIPIRCYTISAGQPRRFIWRAADRRFVPSVSLPSDGAVLQLLGPSESLVKKHWDRLPVGSYLAFALTERVPVEGITANNELSFVVRFEYEGQHLLVTGDAGCVDFKIGRKRTFHPALLRMMSDLHVVQVAHHAGHNAEFYNVLLASQYPDQAARSFLLLSHEVRDSKRPSAIFGKFIEKALRPADILRLLFTSQPIKRKVENYEQIVYRVVGIENDRGNIRMEYDGHKWRVIKHAIAVKPDPTPEEELQRQQAERQRMMDVITHMKRKLKNQ